MILKIISNLQVKQDSFYNQGLFPSQIIWAKGKKSVEDNNIFFNVLIIYVLESLKSTLSKNDQKLIDNISSQTKKTFKFYKNRNGDITYNYYQVQPEKPFPGFNLFSKFNFAKLPDDLDCTAILYLTKSSSDSVNHLLKQKMSKQSFKKDKITSTFKEYRNSLAYRSWFADKMKQDLDVVVNCNVLTFVFQKELPLESVDYDAISFIQSVVATNKHIEKGYLVSPHYQKPSIILYHIARLISVANHEQLNQLREKIISDLYLKLECTICTMERIILLSSLYRLNEKVDFQIDLNRAQKDMDDFYWYRTNFLCGHKFWIKKIFGKDHFLNYKNKSEAYYWSLILELEKISNANIKTIENQHITMYKKH